MWQTGACVSPNSLVLLPKQPFISHYSRICIELWLSTWLRW